MDDKVRSKLEPKAVSVKKRIMALRQLHESGISTYVFVGPILPVFTDLNSIFHSVNDMVDTIWGESLNIRAGNWKNIEAALKKHFPDMLSEFKEMVQNHSFWDEVEREFKSLSNKFEIPLIGFYRH
jgi:DNA repair photolyase